MEKIDESIFNHFLSSNIEAPICPSTSQTELEAHITNGNIIVKDKQQPNFMLFMNSSINPKASKINVDNKETSINETVKGTPVYYLEKFLDATVIDWFIIETNKNLNKTPNFQSIKDHEIKCFIAILYLSGYLDVPRRRMLWERSPDTHNALVANAIQRDRFNKIFTALYTNETTEAGRTPLENLKMLIDYINMKFMEHSPKDNLHSIAECTIPQGHQNQALNLRPKVSTHCWCACISSGYCTWFNPLTSLDPHINPNLIILNYARQIKKLGQDQNLTFETSCASPALQTEIESLGINGNGVVREKNGCVQSSTLGGIEKLDYNMVLYRITMKGKKQFFALLTYVLDMILHNAWQLHREKTEEKKQLDLLAFRRDIVIYYLEHYGRPLPSPKPCRIVKMKKKGKYKKNMSDARFDGILHYVIPQPKQTRCGRCSGKTTTRCQKCDVGVHVKCFVDYHQKPKDYNCD